MVSKIGDWYKLKGEVAYVLNFPFSLGKTATYLCGIKDTLIGLAGERRGVYIDMSLRACTANIDLNAIMRNIAPGLGGSGGGHPSASGARIPEKNFKKLLRELNAYINNEKGKQDDCFKR
jgi:RecJ-like exonuclease